MKIKNPLIIFFVSLLIISGGIKAEEIFLKCINEDSGNTFGEFSVTKGVNNCNSQHCIEWSGEAITIRNKGFHGITVILRKDLSYAFLSADFPAAESEGQCEIVESENIL